MRYSIIIKCCDVKSQGAYYDVAFELGCDLLEIKFID